MGAVLYVGRANGYMTDEQFERYKKNCLNGFRVSLFDDPVILRSGETLDRIEWGMDGSPSAARNERVTAIIYPLSLEGENGPIELSPRESERQDGWYVEKCQALSWTFSQSIGPNGFTSTSQGTTTAGGKGVVDRQLNALDIDGLPTGEHRFTGEFRVEYFLNDKPMVNNTFTTQSGLPDDHIRTDTVRSEFTVLVVEDLRARC